ncbi:hypothetical protein CKO23_09190 [Thiocystis violacea]|nr:hypothetical protein [Thiocystis violacea]
MDLARRVAPNHTGRLVLTTLDPHASPQRVLLVEMLAEKGFIGERLAQGEVAAYAIGPGFLSLLTFAGCAVRIRSEPDAGAPFCHIQVPPVREHPYLLAGRNTRAPRCVGCRARLLDWRERRAHWASHPHAGVTCPTCRETRPPWLWDWKQQGGFGRLFIQIEEIFPDEATPTPALFDLLIRATGTGWRHFYIQD